MFTAAIGDGLSFNYCLIYGRPLIKSGKRVDYYSREMTFPVELIRFAVILPLPPTSLYPLAIRPSPPHRPPPTYLSCPDHRAATFNVRQVFRFAGNVPLYFLNRDFDASVYSPRSSPFFFSPSPSTSARALARTLSLYFSQAK